MAIIPYEQWYDLTYERFNWRGGELTGVDNALKAYHKAPGVSTGQVLKSALDTYIAFLNKSAGSLEKSSRNSKGGVITLRDEVSDLLNGEISEESRMLRALMIEHRHAAIVRLFGGRKIVIKRRNMPPLVQRAQGVKEKGGLMADALGLVADIIKKIMGEAAAPAEVPAVIAVLGNEFMNNMALAAMPFMGGAVSAAKGIAKGYDAVNRALQGRAIKTKHIHFVMPGNAMAAAEALVELVRRQRNDSAAKAGLYTASAALQISSNFFPGGNFVGSATKIAESFGLMVMDAQTAAQEIRELKAANHVLAYEPRKLCEAGEIFEVYPLIGAYFLRFGNVNDVLSALSRDIGTLHWREVIGEIKKRHLEPMREISMGFIQDSRFELQGMHVAASGILGISGLVEKAEEKMSTLIDSHLLGNKPAAEFIRDAQPFITTPEAIAEVRKKASEQLQGRKGWTTDDLGRRTPAALDARSREQVMADLRKPITAQASSGGPKRYSADV